MNAFREFMKRQHVLAEEYGCGVSGQAEDIAREAWEKATRIALEECAKICDELDRHPDHLHPADCADAIRKVAL